VARDYTLDFAPTRLTFPRVTSPFRDEIESLRRENAELRAELANSRGPRPFLGMALAGVDVATAVMLRPWLNAGSDSRFWGALAILGVITFAAGWATVGYKRRVL
jgi:hypothetical protein